MGGRVAACGGAATVATIGETTQRFGNEIEVPPEEGVERHIEIREPRSTEVITMVKLLTPWNKEPGDGRRAYKRKRSEILQSQTSLVEIDLLRDGEPMEMEPVPPSHYRIVVSPAWERPVARFYGFGIRDPIPAVPVPLRQDEEEACLAIGDLLPGIYDRAIYDLDTDYAADPPPPALSPDDLAWIDERLRSQGRRS